MSAIDHESKRSNENAKVSDTKSPTVPSTKLTKKRASAINIKATKTSSAARSANTFTDTTRVIDPKLTPAEQRQLDQAIEADIEFSRESANAEAPIFPVLPPRLDT